MEWRAILAVALSIFVLILWQYVFVPLPEPPHSSVKPESQEKPAPETNVSPAPMARSGAPPTSGADDNPVEQVAPPQSLNERLQKANYTPSVTQLMVTAQQ